MGSTLESVVILILKLGAALALGFSTFRFGILSDRDSLAFLAGRVGLPLLVFKSVVTADLGDLDPACLLSCTAGKAFVHLLACAASFIVLKHQPFHSRLIAAGIFSFHVTASNDMVIGIPIVQTFFPKGGMTQLAANVVVQYVVFQSASIVLLEIGLAQQRASAASEASPCGRVGSRLVVSILWSIVCNPLICSIIAAFAYRLLALPFTPTGEAPSLPPGIREGVDFFTEPFSMIALFLTGANLSNALDYVASPGSVRRALYFVGVPVLLCTGKNVVCAFVSLFVGEGLMPRTELGQPDWHRFAFLYGSIPTSSAPLLVAMQAGQHSEVVAAAIFLGLILAVPMLVASASLFGEKDDSAAFVQGIRAVQIATAWVSTISALAALTLGVQMRWSDDGWRRTPRVFLLWYALACLPYGVTSIALEAVGCANLPLRFAFAYFQMQCRVWAGIFLAHGVWRLDSGRRERHWVLLAWLLPLLLCAVAPASTINEVCQLNYSEALEVVHAAFVAAAFLVLTGLGLCGLRRWVRRQEAPRASEAVRIANPLLGAPGGDRLEELSAPGGMAKAETQGPWTLEASCGPGEEQDPLLAMRICCWAIALRAMLLFLLQTSIGWSIVVTRKAWAPGFAPAQLQAMLVENFVEHSPGAVLLLLLCTLFDTPAARLAGRIRSRLGRPQRDGQPQVSGDAQAGVDTSYLLRPMLRQDSA